MKRFLPILLLTALLAGPQARAQLATQTDTSAFRTPEVQAPAFRASQLIAPGALIASGIGIHCFGHESIDGPVNTWFQEKLRAGGPELKFDNYIQYLPIVSYLGLGLVGAKAEHGFVETLRAFGARLRNRLEDGGAFPCRCSEGGNCRPDP